MIFDYDLPGINGLELVQRARKLAHRSRTPVAVLSATPVEAEAREAGADVFLRKPLMVRAIPLLAKLTNQDWRMEAVTPCIFQRSRAIRAGGSRVALLASWYRLHRI